MRRAVRTGITVVIPVYNAFDCLPALTASVAALDPAPDEVILIDDASPDARVRPWLQAHIVDHDLPWLLVLHQENLGFVRSANEGLAYARRHCLLLNQDTVCERRLLAKLSAAVDAVPEAGTVTPFSNNGEIVSLPAFCAVNPMPEDVEAMARACEAAGPPGYPELPTAVGFCMLITRRALDTVGVFDAERFGHGYGEENDYSRRVHAAGLRNLLCDDAYVAHVGNQSFADLGMRPDEATLARVLERHPDYLELVRGFIDADPLQARRDAIIEALASRDGRA
jgi:GT2 family glycosyltransferase